MAVLTKAQIQTKIDSYFVTGGNITADQLNEVCTDINDSNEPLIQEYTTAQRDALPNLEGRKIYNTTSNRLEYYSSSKWLPCSQKETVAVDCSANPNYPDALVGDQYIVTVAGKIGGGSGTSVYVGDLIYCIAANAGGTQASVGSSWKITHSGSDSDSPMLYAAITLSSAQILALNTTPQTLVAAPGAGKIIVPFQIAAYKLYNSIPYATNTAMCVNMGSVEGQSIMTLSGTTNLYSVTPYSALQSTFDNEALKVSVQTGNPTAGNSGVRVYCWYKILTL